MKPIAFSLRNFVNTYDSATMIVSSGSYDSATMIVWPMIVPQSCVFFECLGFTFMLFSFSKWGQIMILSTQLIQWYAVRWRQIPAASSLLSGEKVAHFEIDTASEQ